MAIIRPMAKRKRSEHYVNNKEFLAALIKYREDVEIARLQDKVKPVIPRLNAMLAKINLTSSGYFSQLLNPLSQDSKTVFKSWNKYLKEWKNKSSFKYLYSLIKKMRINEKLIEDIEKNNIKKINNAIDNALKDKFLDFNSSLKCNFVTSYSKIIKKFNNKKLNFKTGQKDTKLAPY